MPPEVAVVQGAAPATTAPAPGLMTAGGRQGRLAAAGGVSGVTMALEAAIDEDGDIKLWRRELSVRLLGEKAARAVAAFWREAAMEGCGGELYQRGNGMVHGRISCSDGRTPPKLGGAARRKEAAAAGQELFRRGSVLWTSGAAPASSWAGRTDFVIVVSDHAQPADHQLARATKFGEVELTSWESVKELHSLPVGNGGRFEPPLQLKLAAH